MIKEPGTILEEYWGFQAFKGSQEAIINAVLANEDVLALLPTGGGKSVCYQIPALMKEGICIVVSPLIALIQDQVNQLKSRGIKAIALTGGIHFDEVIDLLDNCLYGNYKFLYLSPERLRQQLVQERITEMNVNLLAIDEAHCISQWGNDFRPAYLDCAVLRELKPDIPVIALTATATREVSKDIIENLTLSPVRIFKDSFSRENIAYAVLREEDKLYRIKQLCASSAKSGIVYVRTRRAAEELSTYLNKNRIAADYFHGGTSRGDREKKLKQWLSNTTRIMVATNAFGMGVDKADVSLVVHYHIPDSLESYFQESGRAGRDGAAASAIIVTNKNDEVQVKSQFLDVLPDVGFLKKLYRKLNAYFRIPYGEGTDERFQFRLHSFCETYDLNTTLAYNGLRILDQNSVIALSQAFSRSTTIRFLVSKKQMIDYLEIHRGLAPIVQVILRTYGGVFDFDTKINTVLLSKKAAVAEDDILRVLEQLNKDGIISYQAQHSDLEITFLVPREDDITIHTFAGKVKAYQQVKRENVQQMLSYIHNDVLCRNRQLLLYFGEKNAGNCGRCDVCKKKNKKPAPPGLVAERILGVLSEKSLTSRKLIERLPFDTPMVLEALQMLLEDQKISINTRNEYMLR